MQQYSLNTLKFVLLLLIVGNFFILFTACKKFVDADAPTTSLTGENVYQSDATAASVLTGIYTKMSLVRLLGSQGVTRLPLLTGLSSDELTLFNTSSSSFVPYYRNNLSASQIGSELWTKNYEIIYIANSAIEGLTESTSLTTNVKSQLLGEAKFIRAFCYFNLVNLYGELPLVLTAAYNETQSLTRSSPAKVYDQIVADLVDAKSLLSNDYLNSLVTKSVNERLRPNKMVAAALLARVYLYRGDWSNAAAEATLVINDPRYTLPTNLNAVFLKTSLEAIWQLQPVVSEQNTPEAMAFVLPPSGPSNSSYPIYLSDYMVNDFEPSDKRKDNWVGQVTASSRTYYYPYKYKSTITTPVTEYSVVFRLAEQFLIRAEAGARQGGNLTQPIADLDIIRQRASIPLIRDVNPAISTSDLLDTILHERRVELFTEGGHRWFDLKRTGTVDSVMAIVTPKKGGAWDSTDQLYPLPLGDIQANQNLLQNPGYH